LTDCIFCKIAAGEAPPQNCHTLYEDEHTYAFLDLHPVNPGHSLVIPKKHYVNILDAPTEIMQQMIATAKKIAEALMKNGAEGVNVNMNNQAPAGQVIFHAHMHVIPRYGDDGLKHWQKIPTTNEELDAKAEEIKKLITN
jgi:histidine triad (HIT) family protein